MEEINQQLDEPPVGWDKEFVENIGGIAAAYAQMPDQNEDPEVLQAWRELAADSMARMQELSKQIHMEVVDDPEPYATAEDMFKDINENNHFFVSRANSEHPVWTPEENVAFRAVHDILGHAVSGGDFGWEGENRACSTHFPLLTPLAQKALFTECIGQTGYSINYNDFGPQKIGFLDEIFLPAQERENAASHEPMPAEESVVPEATPQTEPSVETGLPSDVEAPHEAEEAGWPQGWYNYQKGYPIMPVVTKRNPVKKFIDRFKKSNILDPIYPYLDPLVWSDPESPKPKIREEHRLWIYQFITNALHMNGYTHTDQWLSLVLTGSLTTYQYSEDSDCDISLFVNSEKFPEWSRAEMIGIMIEQCDGVLLPGTNHPLQCYAVPQEFTKEDLYKPGLRSGYDLTSNTWIVEPEKNRSHDVKEEMNSTYVGALEGADKMERLLRYEPDKAVMYYKQIHSRRKRDMEAGKGDYSSSNIIYKMLDSRGLLSQVSNLMPKYGAAGKEKLVTILFCDIKGFSESATHETDSETVDKLNKFYDIVIPIVQEHGGEVNKLVADGVMAIFDSESNPDHIFEAVNAGRDIVDAIDLEPDLDVGVGIHTGEAMVGELQGGDVFDYTAIGDTVNTASRIEQLTRGTDDSLLISNIVADHVHGPFESRGTFDLDTSSEPIEVFALIDA